MSFSGEKRDPAARDLEAQHTSDKSGDRRPDRNVPLARRIPGRLRQRVRVHDRQHQPWYSGVRCPTGYRVEIIAPLHVPRPRLRYLYGAYCYTFGNIVIVYMNLRMIF